MQPESKPEQRPAQNWETVIELVKQRNTLPQDVLLLRDAGDTAVVAFTGEPFAFEAVWEESNGWVPFDRQKDLHKNTEPALRILINVVVKTSNPIVEFTPRYWEMDVDTFKRLLALRKNYGLDDWLFRIVRFDDTDAAPCYGIRVDEQIYAELKAFLASLPRICLATAKGLPRDQ